MLKALECLDIKLIEQIRSAGAGRGLDERDSLSWHLVLRDDDIALGEARLYAHKDGIMVEPPILLADVDAHKEMLFRTLLLKCEMMQTKTVYTAEHDAYYAQFGFKANKEGGMTLDMKDLVYPKLCQQCKSDKQHT